MNPLPRIPELERDYEFLRELGRGGTAVVYLARERELGRQVAVKLVLPSFTSDPHAVARLEREARLIATLNHPNIVPLLGARRLQYGGLALIYQYVGGPSLKRAIRIGGPVPLDVVQLVLWDIGSALDYAHRRHGIVHRDIKPDNIYLDPDRPAALLSDFGIARALGGDSDITVAGSTLGTPAYMSPEQVDGSHLDGRSDLYSLGLVAYEMLTGKQPWAGETLYSIIYKQKHEDLPPLAEQRPDAPPKLIRAVEGLLRKDPARRWPDAAMFLAAIRSVDIPRAKVLPPAWTHLEIVDWLDPSAHAPTIRFEPKQPEIGPDAAATPPQRETRDAARPAVSASESASERTPRDLDPPASASATTAPGSAGDPVNPAAPAGPLPGAPVAASRPVPSRRPPLNAVPIPAGAGAGGLRPPGLPPFRGPASGAARPAKQSRLRIIAGTVVVVLLGSAGALAMIVNRDRGVADELPATPDVTGSTAVSAPPLAAAPGVPPGAAPPELTPPTLTVGPPARIRAVAGDAQVGVVGRELPIPLQVRVEDELGQPVGGVAVEFLVPAGTGVVEPAVAMTDQYGMATTRYTLGDETGEQRVIASVAAPGGVPRTIDFLAYALDRGPSDLIVLGADALAAAPGEPVPGGVAVQIVDETGEPIAGAEVDFAVSVGGGHVEPARAITGPDGIARVTWTLGPETGVQGLIVSLPLTGLTRSIVASAFRRVETRPGIAVGGMHTCRLSPAGLASCWGANDNGQLGDGSGRRVSSAVNVAAPAPLALIVAGISHTCGLDPDGVAYCWGSNASGQLGTGDTQSRPAPTRVEATTPFTRIAAGLGHTCAISDGAAYCWGSNTNGQLGDGTYEDRPRPVAVSSSVRFSSIAAGWTHTCAIANNGAAYCWGANSQGQLGDGSTVARAIPTQVSGGFAFREISAGATHTCGVTTAGRVLCWGQNQYGQLGDGTSESRFTPAPVLSSLTFTAVSAGAQHACALTDAGEAFCWGRNALGQLGNGSESDSAVPVPVQGGLRFESIRASGSHTCGRTTTGQDYCWGYNVEGQLGDGSRTDRSLPTLAGRQP